MMRRLTLAGLALALLVTAGAGAAPDYSALQAEPYEPPKPAPLFTLPDLEGRAVSLEALRGHLVLLFFWATW
jgi:cytochrome oxidase Cu insertion factor (SCO1/SenC/PrrC family)